MKMSIQGKQKLQKKKLSFHSSNRSSASHATTRIRNIMRKRRLGMGLV
uniref:Uncharacterized protein n=1 Tax=Rhizophora mucronata TaxID=61149 RepID=A0A2P2R4K0_RHIMU